MDFLGVDYGTKKTGYAYSIAGICFTGEILPSDDRLVDGLVAIIRAKSLQSVVVGIAKHAHGGISEHGKRTLAWIETFLRPALPAGVSVDTWNEHGTSSDARYLAAEENVHSYFKTQARDADAARLLLEDYLLHHS